MNPCTAVRLLEDFADLQPGDAIVQNGANSTVGHCIYQIAKSRGIQTINVIRSRPGQEQLIEKMKVRPSLFRVTGSAVLSVAYRVAPLSSRAVVTRPSRRATVRML